MEGLVRVLNERIPAFAAEPLEVIPTEEHVVPVGDCDIGYERLVEQMGREPAPVWEAVDFTKEQQRGESALFRRPPIGLSVGTVLTSALFAVNAWIRLREGQDAAMVPWPLCHHVLSAGAQVEAKWKKKRDDKSRRGVKRKQAG